MTRGLRRVRSLVPALLVGLLLAGCTSGAPDVAPVSSAPLAPAVTPTPTATATPSLTQRAEALVTAMSPAERAGQVLMTAGTVAQLPGLASVVDRYHVAGVMVRGRSGAGTAAVAKAFGPVRAAAPDGLPLLTATDQEGGTVQVLSGPGFSRIASAVVQGRGSASATRSDAERWGRQLAAAGVRLDLAPVADVPCAATLHDNPPVAALDRQYSSDPAVAGAHVDAFVAGMRAAGVETAVKHFPGLGCVTANTDTAAHVVDRTTTADSPRLRSFEDGIAAGTGFVMVSSAEYARIDPGTPALFSSRIVRGMLRDRLGFDGVVVSDDVGGAVAVRAWSPGQRAVKFVRAGGDLLLDVQPADLPTMHAALVSTATDDAAFDRALTAAAVRVVTARLRLAD
ncbi:glycoside hydrolase family 3 N-terminal domain-containing protein [Amnibacterium kyonggiense]|uniref:beta-N-acetylhexosaminidase n=1 Tax=Amnibacterium kyonggiense TaxID=595671 RepID=A0A4R7FMD5_9MICO|nr:glycoside hydrolase family 3 N-terminal domain-containing protein [Amnibacterium kyonggiense]TDS77576.1 beta-N-acetylhexosaminidase [Amnibacterium kyonggiense]